ncbi:MAG: hypothetical protein M3015_12680 [Bacteroidota bacterium]|nr:hypothetical protein [Bacteroidota bacterium]
MKIKKSIQIKAAFLMIVFSLNTIIGFSCALGMDMGFNTKHHHDEVIAETAMHIHDNGKDHNHSAAANHHNEASKDHHDSNNEKDNCCNDGVLKFSQMDKSVPGSVSIANSIFFTSFFFTFYNNGNLFSSLETPSIKYFVRSYHPPIPDIRIAIQSFQI